MIVYLAATLIAVAFAYLFTLTNRLSSDNNMSISLKKFSPALLGMSFLSIFVLTAFRVNVGLDYASYAQWFNDIARGSTTYFEPGFMLMVAAIQQFTNNAQWLFIVSSFITLGVIFIVIKKRSVSPALSVFLFCTMGFLSHSMNLMRQFIAVAIALIAYRYIVEKKPLQFLAVIGIAASFHKTALLMAPAYFVLRARLKPIHYLLITVASMVITIYREAVTNFFVSHFYQQYYNETFVGQSIVSKYYIIMSIVLAAFTVYLLCLKRLSLDKAEDRVMVNTVFFIALSHIFFVWVPLSNRVSLYLDITLILIIPQLLRKIDSRERRMFATAAVAAYFAATAYLSLVRNVNGVLPYKSTLSSGTYSIITAHKDVS